MSKRYIIWILIFCSTQLFGQYGRIEGTVNISDNQALPYCTIHIKEINKGVTTNENGMFSFDSIPYGNYTLIFFCLGHNRKDIKVKHSSLITTVYQQMDPLSQELNQVVITNQGKELAGMKRLKPIQDVLISQGKKNEVIELDHINVNKATNSGRQIYARVPGLNIWESDGAGIQLGIGARGLDPSRTSSFNTRQNGYDISADALGYPESYYTPSSESIKEIQLIRGAASLQFGPQFGGLLNFIMKNGPTDQPVEITMRQTVGSFGLINTYLSGGGEINHWNYYAYAQYKRGDDWRPKSAFDLYTTGFNINKQLDEKNKIGAEFTKMHYLTEQAGGLTDKQFQENPYIINRQRNWFRVDWNLAALTYDHEFSASTKLNTRFFGLIAGRDALGYIGRLDRLEDTTANRNLISGNFKNYGNETRFLHVYKKKSNPWAFVVGMRFYKGYTQSKQGEADATIAPNFDFVNLDRLDTEYEFPGTNVSFFGEHVFAIGKFSITPGVRFEHISTEAKGVYSEKSMNLVGDIIDYAVYTDYRENKRQFIIGGLGLNYRFNDSIEVYANCSQNYRSINFTDMQIQNPNFRIDPELKDETGGNIDFGIRGFLGEKLNFDLSAFMLIYDNRIGTTLKRDAYVYQYRTNISKSISNGVEMMVEADLWKMVVDDSSNISLSVFQNLAYIDARYYTSEEVAFQNKKVEFVSPFTAKSGLTLSYKKISTTFQYSFVKEHYSDATNAEFSTSAIVGIIPSYSVMDLSMSYKQKRWKTEFGVNNLGNQSYFTRRATAYPGPGILPSPPRNFYLALEYKF